MSHSKYWYLKSSSFKASSYLVDSRFTKSEAQLLFRLRSKTVNLKVNFPKMYQDNLCKMCKLFPESQAHLLQCPEIVPQLKLVCLKNMDEENLIYSNIENQLKIVKMYSQVMEFRKSFLENEEE